jgi:hypothetical protein
MRGTTFKRCACRDEDGMQLGQSCPQLRSTRHGSWYFVLRVPGQQHPVKKGGFATQAAPDKALQALRSKVTSGTDLTAGQQTVTDYLEEWLAGKAALAAETDELRRAHPALPRAGARCAATGPAARHPPRRAVRAMRQIGTEVRRPSPILRRLLAARTQAPDRDRPLSASRIRRVHATLHSALNSAVRRRRRLQHNPAEHVELASGKAPKAVVWTEARVELWRRTGKRYPVAVWTPEQAGAFLDAVVDDRLYTL